MDINTVKKILTFKSGVFSLTKNYDEKALASLLAEASFLYSSVADLPVLPGMVAKINEDIIKRSIFGTASIEGNPLDEKSVEIVYNENKPEKTTKRAEQEIRNLKSAYGIVSSIAANPDTNLSEERIREIHRAVTLGIDYKDNIPGQYRNTIVKVGDEEHGGVYTPPKILDDIKNLMTGFVAWINSQELINLNPAIRASLAHYHIAAIHPFANGNGRTCRLIEASMLFNAGIKHVPFMLSNYYYKNIDDYFNVFSKVENNEASDVTPFLEFTLKGHIDALKEIKNFILWIIRKLVLKDFYLYLLKEKTVSQRQYDFLLLLLDRKKELDFKGLLEPPFDILFRDLNERTLRRDLENLVGLKLITKTEDKYTLNLKVAG